MKRILSTLLVLLLALVVAPGCKKKTPADPIVELAKQLNARGETKLSDETSLRQCDFNAGDSVFVYHIKVTGNSFDKATEEELKEHISKRIGISDMTPMLRRLAESNVQLKYVYELPDSVEKIVLFSPSELKALLQ